MLDGHYHIDDVVGVLGKDRTALLEGFAKAFCAAEGCSPAEAVLVEERSAPDYAAGSQTVTWHFRKATAAEMEARKLAMDVLLDGCGSRSQESTYRCTSAAGHEPPHEQTLPNGTKVRWW